MLPILATEVWLGVLSEELSLVPSKEEEPVVLVSAAKPSGSIRYPMIPVMSEKAVLLKTTARKAGPSPGPTSLSEGSVEPAVPAEFDKLPALDEDITSPLSTQ
jgi:hypothetical protein